MNATFTTRSAFLDTKPSPIRALTAADVMSRDVVVVRQQLPVREAASRIDLARASEAVVVDEQGRCVGMLFPADVFRWIGAGCPKAVVGPVLSCRYQVHARLLTGAEALVCTLAHGSCPYQEKQPTSGGRYTDLCTRQGKETPPYGSVPCYLTTDVVAVRPETPLSELVQLVIDARAERILVRDEADRPMGIIFVADVLKAVAGTCAL
jgi:CBS domain-containing protein